MEYRVLGTTMPVVELTLEQNEKIRAQPGAMKWMTSGMQMHTNLTGGMFGAIKRSISGEDAFLTYFEATGERERVAFGHTFPGYIISLDISQQAIVCQKRAFLCSQENVNFDIYFQQRLGSGFFGGEGFVMQKLSGNGLAFVEIDGECIELTLQPGESIKVETGAVGMFEETVQMDIKRVKGFRNLLLGGEGLFLTTLTGPGKIWLQTMPIQSMVGEISTYLQQEKGGKRKRNRS